MEQEELTQRRMPDAGSLQSELEIRQAELQRRLQEIAELDHYREEGTRGAAAPLPPAGDPAAYRQLLDRLERLEARVAELEAGAGVGNQGPPATDGGSGVRVQDSAWTLEGNEKRDEEQGTAEASEQPRPAAALPASDSPLPAPDGDEVPAVPGSRLKDQGGEPETATPGSPRQAPDSARHAAHEAEINQYMSQLLERMRSPAAAPVAPAAPPAPTAPSTPKRDSGLEHLAAVPIKRRVEDVKIVPRAVAPEKSFDLSALRELANASAQHALDHHERQGQAQLLRGQTIVSGVASLLGMGCLYLWWRFEAGPRVLFAGMVSLSVAVAWSLRRETLRSWLARLGFGRPTSPPAAEQPVPAAPADDKPPQMR